MSGSKGLNPHELAHRWVKDLGTRSDMSIKVGCQSHDMRISDRIVGVRSTEQSAGIKIGAFAPDIIFIYGMREHAFYEDNGVRSLRILSPFFF